MMAVRIDSADNFHPYECDGYGLCIHCDRKATDNHHPDVCALCDPEYDLRPNKAWDERLAREATA